MECKVVQQFLDAYLNQALGDEQTKQVEEHLFECDDCFKALAESQELVGELNDPELQHMVLTEPLPLPADFTAQVMQRVEDEHPRKVNVIWPWLRKHWTRRQYASVAYAMSATMVVVSAGNLLFLWNESTDQLSVWAAQVQAYWEAFQAFITPAFDWLVYIWQAVIALLYLG
ncbi:MAG: anti-sigma factor family protein [Bacillota bacterium]